MGLPSYYGDRRFFTNQQTPPAPLSTTLASCGVRDKIASNCGGKTLLQNRNGFIAPINTFNAVSRMASIGYYEPRLERIHFVY